MFHTSANSSQAYIFEALAVVSKRDYHKAAAAEFSRYTTFHVACFFLIGIRALKRPLAMTYAQGNQQPSGIFAAFLLPVDASKSCGSSCTNRWRGSFVIRRHCIVRICALSNECISVRTAGLLWSGGSDNHERPSSLCLSWQPRYCPSLNEIRAF